MESIETHWKIRRADALAFPRRVAQIPFAVAIFGGLPRSFCHAQCRGGNALDRDLF
jgi:hypothetical protein